MKLKDYQNEVLESLSGYLAALEAKRQEAEEFVQFQKTKAAPWPWVIIAGTPGMR
jgi:hypothetical protein